MSIIEHTKKYNVKEVGIIRDVANKIESGEITQYIFAAKTNRGSSLVVSTDNPYGLKAAINRATKED
jgi:hypothetical protein